MIHEEDKTAAVLGWGSVVGITAAGGLAALNAPIPAFLTAIATCWICVAYMYRIPDDRYFTKRSQSGKPAKATVRGVPDNIPFFTAIGALALMFWITGPGSEPGTWPNEWRTFEEWRNQEAVAECESGEIAAKIARLCSAYLEERD